MKELDAAEADALIALLAVPDPLLPAGKLSALELVRKFVEDSDIRPGRAAEKAERYAAKVRLILFDAEDGDLSRSGVLTGVQRRVPG